MKKIFVMVLGLSLLASTAIGGIGINWNTINGMLRDGLPNDAFPPAGGFLLDGYSAIWQLIYAGANNVIDRIDDSANPVDQAAWAANSYLRPGGDDELIAQRTIALGGGTATEDGTQWSSWMVNEGGSTTYQLLADGGQSWWDGGSVYMRIFQVGPDGMEDGTQFYQTPSSDLLTIDTSFTGGTGFAQNLLVADGSTFGVPTYQVDATVIPEPATMGLLGLGALVMAIRRRRS